MTILLQVDTVVLADSVGEVGEERDVQFAKTTLGPWGGHPGKVGEVGVNWAGYHLELSIQRPVRSTRAKTNLGAKGPELFHPVVEGEDLGGTDEGEVQWVEKENQVLSYRKNTLTDAIWSMYYAKCKKLPK